MAVSTLLEAASTFLLQSPPGEVNDVFNDCRTIVSDDAALEKGILPALSKYNMEQFIVVDLDGKSVLITEESKLQTSSPTSEAEEAGERHLDPRSSQTFIFDHMRVAASSPLPHPTDAATESLRSSIDKLLDNYVKNHYNEGVCTVYSSKDERYPEEWKEEVVEVEGEEAEEEAVVEEKEAPKEEMEVTEEKEVEEPKEEQEEPTEEKAKREEISTEEPLEEEEKVSSEATPSTEPPATDTATPLEIVTPKPKPKQTQTIRTLLPLKSRLFTLYLVGNKYNPSNYWTGRWRSIYKIDWEKGTLEGKCWINVHYYEQGNVQLSTTLTSSSTLSLPPSPTLLLAELKKSEIAFQTTLNNTYSILSEESFKSLRRSLPKTRSKLDWNLIGGYRLGGQLGGTKD